MERRAAAEAGVEESASDASGPRDMHPRARSSGAPTALQGFRVYKVRILVPHSLTSQTPNAAHLHAHAHLRTSQGAQRGARTLVRE